MFDKMKNVGAQMQLMRKLMKDENFQRLMAHPKMQAFLRDPEFINLMKEQNFEEALKNPKLAALRDDPELFQLFSRMRLPS